MHKPRTAIVHDYLVQYGGAEKTLEAILELFPDAPIYTGLYSPTHMSESIKNRKIIGPKNGILSKLQKYLTFLMPLLFESFDLRDYELIISDGTAWSKGVLTKPEQLHISYVHTPPRFLYGYSVESQKRNKWYFKPIVRTLDFFLRMWDYSAAQRPNVLLTNSFETQKRINKFYRRDAKVIYPPVETHFTLKNDKNVEHADYYVALGRLAAYKNFDLLVKAFNQLNQTLVIIGTGTEEEQLKRLANLNIKFEGRVSEERKHLLLENCLGVIDPVVDEDFGIVPLEAMAHGKPVLAHKSGGHLETVKENVSGLFFDSLLTEDFLQAFENFDKKVRSGEFEAETIRATVQNFNKERFKKEIDAFIAETWQAFREKA